jgi:hypothetical protein
MEDSSKNLPQKQQREVGSGNYGRLREKEAIKTRSDILLI